MILAWALGYLLCDLCFDNLAWLGCLHCHLNIVELTRVNEKTVLWYMH